MTLTAPVGAVFGLTEAVASVIGVVVAALATASESPKTAPTGAVSVIVCEQWRAILKVQE